MFKKWYIRHVDGVNRNGDVSVWGPFERHELDDLMSDEYAGFMMKQGEVKPIRLGWWRRRHVRVHTPEHWLAELSRIQDYLYDRVDPAVTARMTMLLRKPGRRVRALFAIFPWEV